MSVIPRRFRITSGILARSVGDRLVLFHPESERLFSLQGTGIRIWELLSEEEETVSLIARLTNEFAASPSLIHQQVVEFLSQLESEQIIWSHNESGIGVGPEDVGASILP